MKTKVTQKYKKNVKKIKIKNQNQNGKIRHLVQYQKTIKMESPNQTLLPK